MLLKNFLYVSVGILMDRTLIKKKKDSVEFFISMYKLLFLCFQETGNGSKVIIVNIHVEYH